MKVAAVAVVACAIAGVLNNRVVVLDTICLTEEKGEKAEERKEGEPGSREKYVSNFMSFGSLDQEESDGESSGSSFRYRGTRFGSSSGTEGTEAADEELSPALVGAPASAEVSRPGLEGSVAGIFGLHSKEK